MRKFIERALIYLNISESVTEDNATFFHLDGGIERENEPAADGGLGRLGAVLNQMGQSGPRESAEHGLMS